MGKIGAGEAKNLAWRVVSGILGVLLVLVIVASINFLAFRMDDSQHLLIPKGASSEYISELREEYRLDDSLFVQYLSYLAHTLTGDYYRSVGPPVGTEIDSYIYEFADRTVFLLVTASITSALLGLVWGRSSARRSGTLSGRVLHFLALIFLVLPLLASAAFSIRLIDTSGLDPPPGGDGFGEGVLGVLEHAALPLLCLTAFGAGFFALVTRAGYLRAEKHGARIGPARALSSVSPIPCYLIPLLVSVLLVVELVFSYGGLLYLFLEAVRRDVPLMMACFFVLSAITLFGVLVFRLALYGAARLGSASSREMDSASSSEDSVPALRENVGQRLSLSQVIGSSRRLSKEFLRSRAGTLALAGFVVLLLAGLLADYISIDQDPWQLSGAVGGRMEILEPPSLAHPLGTDAFGRDLYSLNLYASRADVILVLSVSFFSLLMGLSVGYLRALTSGRGWGQTRRVVGWLLASLRDLAISVPVLILLVFFAWLSPVGPFGFLGCVVLVSGLLWLWAWPLMGSWAGRRGRSHPAPVRSGRGPRAQLKTSLDDFRAFLPWVLSRTMFVTKFAVVIALIVSGALAIIRPFPVPEFFDWSGSWEVLLWSGYAQGSFIAHLWLVVPPIVGIMMLAACSYVILNTLENIFARHAGDHTSARGDNVHDTIAEGSTEAELDSSRAMT